MSFELNRREFVIGSVAAACSIAYPWSLLAAPMAKELLIAPEIKNDKFSIGIIDLAQDKIFRIQVGHYGHVVIPHLFGSSLAVMAAQRPGKTSYLFDTKTKKNIQSFNSSPGRHFYGHGIFMENGTEIWMTENEDKTGRGHIVIREFPSLKIKSVFSTEGYAPHELKLFDDNKKLVIANGGNVEVNNDILLYKKETIESSVSYFDVANQKLLKKHASPFKEMSVRHLDVHLASKTAVLVLKKYPASSEKTYPPIAYQEFGKEISFFDAPEYLYKQLDSMCLSVTINQESGQFAVTSPISDTVTFWDLQKKSYLGQVSIKNPNGVCCAKGGDAWVVTTVGGEIFFIDAKTLKPINGLNKKFEGLNAFHVINTGMFTS